MNRSIIAFILFLFAFAPPPDASGSEIIPVDGFAAVVNNRVITVGEVMAALTPVEQQLRMRYSGRELSARLEEAYEDILNSMIENALILEAFKEREGEIPRQLVDEHIDGIIAERFDGDRGAFLNQLSAEGISKEEWRQDVRDRLAVMLLRNEEVTPRVVLSPRRVRREYERRLDEFTESGGTRLRMITIHREATEEHPDPAALAASVWEQATDDGDFQELARTYSQDGRAARGGDWGWIEPDILRKELADVAGTLEPGQTSDVIETDDAFYILYVEARRPETVTPFAEVRDELEQELRRAEERRVYQSWINRLRNRHHVHVHPLPRAGLAY